MNRKTALITGAAKGIGRAITLELARAGYNVVINYHSDENAARTLKEAAEEQGARALTVYADMASVAEIKAMYDQAIAAFGQIDLVVNNAGISSEVYFLDAREEDFDRMTAIDWKGL